MRKKRFITLEIRFAAGLFLLCFLTAIIVYAVCVRERVYVCVCK